MSLCVSVFRGRLQPLSIPPESCTDYILLDASEYTGGLVLADLFAIPPSAELTSAWVAGFSLPLIIYLAAWALGVVVNFINTK